MRIGLGVDVFSAARPQKTAEDAENQTVNLENPISATSIPREAENQTADLENHMCTTPVAREAEAQGSGPRVGLIEPFLIKYESVALQDLPFMTYHPSRSGAQKPLPLLEEKSLQAPK